MEKMLDKQDQMLDRQDETTGEVRGLRSDLKESLDVRLRRIEAGPRRECCRPWGRRAASDRFNAPPTFDSARRIGGHLRHRGRILLWTDPALDGSRREGGGGGVDGYPEGFFLRIWITAGLGLISIGGSRTVDGGGGGPLMLDRAFARRLSRPP
jgi:hypothetical protein